MKAMVCEMCGNNDLIKQDGCYVCQYCGTKYSVDEARKLIVEVEGAVDVSGSTVKIDRSGELINLYTIARRAFAEGNYQDAKKYYDMILLKDASGWEAVFYSTLCKIEPKGTKNTTTAVKQCTGTVFTLIRDNIEDINEQNRIVSEIRRNCDQMATILLQPGGVWDNVIENMSKESAEQYHNIQREGLADIMFNIGDKIDTVFPNRQELNSAKIAAWKRGIGIYDSISESNKGDVYKVYIPKIQKYDSSFRSSYSGHCYVATAVYGSYNCPEVWTLRRYRDNELANIWYGKMFIHVYYTVSPILVKRLGGINWLKKMVKRKLDQMVRKLQEKGYESTFYLDKEWE